jgi:hypothetical protein
VIQTEITGTTSWGGLVTDMSSARDWVESQLDGWAEKLGWSGTDQYAAEADLEAAAQASDDAAIFGDDPKVFWQTLADRAAGWKGGAELAGIWQSAGATVDTSAETEYDWSGYADDMISDAAYGIEQVEDVAQSGVKAAKLPAVWGIGAGIAALGLGAYLLL